MKITKALALLMCAILAVSLPLAAFAQAKLPDTELEGYITELVEGGFLMEDVELGQVMLNVDDQTVMDGILLEKDLEVGQYVLVTYDGKLTRSIPPQAHADVVGCYILQGIVGDFMEDGIMLTNDELFGDVLVHVDSNTKHIYPNVPITVYYDGVMAMSLPGQVSAREIVVPELAGKVSDLSDQGFTLTDEKENVYRVLITDDTLIGELVTADGEIIPDADQEPETPTTQEETADPETPEAAAVPEQTEGLAEGFETINYDRALQDGDQVTVYYNGEMITDEIAQVTALEVLAVLNRE